MSYRVETNELVKHNKGDILDIMPNYVSGDSRRYINRTTHYSIPAHLVESGSPWFHPLPDFTEGEWIAIGKWIGRVYESDKDVVKAFCFTTNKDWDINERLRNKLRIPTTREILEALNGYWVFIRKGRDQYLAVFDKDHLMSGLHMDTRKWEENTLDITDKSTVLERPAGRNVVAYLYGAMKNRYGTNLVLDLSENSLGFRHLDYDSPIAIGDDWVSIWALTLEGNQICVHDGDKWARYISSERQEKSEIEEIKERLNRLENEIHAINQ